MPSVASAALSQSTDSTYNSARGSVTVLVPKYWLVEESNISALNDSQVSLITIKDQAQQASRVTRVAYILSSDAAGVFNLPTSLAGKLSPEDLVNYYMNRALSSSVGGKVLSATIKERYSQKIYSIEWTYISIGQLQFRVFDEFVFKGGRVYQTHAEFATFEPQVRDLVDHIVQSVKITQ